MSLIDEKENELPPELQELIDEVDEDEDYSPLEDAERATNMLNILSEAEERLDMQMLGNAASSRLLTMKRKLIKIAYKYINAEYSALFPKKDEANEDSDE